MQSAAHTKLITTVYPYQAKKYKAQSTKPGAAVSTYKARGEGAHARKSLQSAQEVAAVAVGRLEDVVLEASARHLAHPKKGEQSNEQRSSAHWA
eukprot:1159705-Pelagomonas_calceolata.AAC.15